ncbi:hypothetical protein F2Q69_00018057 [Brassica cretica]|uniref:Uncharacterized protein n=1 Tax=Brassica cretica TaxID=69181 RepID=A0A8S9QVJ0_BRACR|nr:hypothetical protein F2Q69_00018057 [Brassica cretica]
MATSVESSSSSEIMEDSHSPAIPQSPLPHPLLSSIPSAKIATTTVENAASWIDETMRQALVYQSTIVETLDSKIDASKSRLAQIRDTSITHTSQTIDSIREIASEYNVYEHMVFAKIKDGVNVAASHPLVSGGLAFGVGIFALKKTRRFVYYNAVRMFSTEEALLSRADLRVKELRQSLDRLTAESEKLEVSFFSRLEGYRLLCRLPMYAVSQLEVECQPETVFSDIKTTIPFRTGQWNAIVEFGLILVCPKKLLVIKTYSTLVRPVDVNLISPEFNDMHQQPHDQEKSLFDRNPIYALEVECPVFGMKMKRNQRVATVAEDELIRGRMKLRQAGKQIRGVVQSAYKIEKQAAGLKDVLKELPTREASRFRSQISNRASEVKQERKALTKEVNKISNYGISV